MWDQKNGAKKLFPVWFRLFGFVEKRQIPLVELVKSFFDFWKCLRREPVGQEQLVAPSVAFLINKAQCGSEDCLL